MPEKTAKTIKQQIDLLKKRGMIFRDEDFTYKILSVVSYYRLEGYWWDMQEDKTKHRFYPNSVFEDVVDRYEFDKQLKFILFKAIEAVEISLRTKIIYYLSLSYGANWYLNRSLFENQEKYDQLYDRLTEDFNLSKEAFVLDHQTRFPGKDPEAWKIIEIASLGTLSKLYKNLGHQLPEKSQISNDFGLQLHSELSSWLESVVYIRNIIAHHSRLWSRTMSKRPKGDLIKPLGPWLNNDLSFSQKMKPFLIISTLVYLCDRLDSKHKVRKDILKLICTYPKMPIYKLGFTDGWIDHPLWK